MCLLLLKSCRVTLLLNSGDLLRWSRRKTESQIFQLMEPSFGRSFEKRLKKVGKRRFHKRDFVSVMVQGLRVKPRGGRSGKSSLGWRERSEEWGNGRRVRGKEYKVSVVLLNDNNGCLRTLENRDLKEWEGVVGHGWDSDVSRRRLFVPLGGFRPRHGS